MNAALTFSPLFLTALLIATICLPLLLAGTACIRRMAGFGLAISPWAPLPGLVLTACPEVSIDLPWLLLGMRLGMDAIARQFLLFTTVLWWIAGLYAHTYLAQDPGRKRFIAFFLASLSGNLGVILAQDVASFYLFFALMTFSVYGLIVHEGGEEAYHAGKVYLILAVIGEVLLFTAFTLAVSAADTLDLVVLRHAIVASAHGDWIVGLILAGFGIKGGALFVHMWLPLAHPVAPTPASAVLSGVIIKAGLLGWLRFLPWGGTPLPEWGAWCMVAGLGAAFYGVGVGLSQRNAKTILAYSSLSQMGLITVLVGLGLMLPSAWPLFLTTTLVYATHHAFAKSALFLGVGVNQIVANRAKRRWVLVGLILPALVLAGAPLSSGALAKQLFKDLTELAPAPWDQALAILLPLATVGTTLLFARFLVFSARELAAHKERRCPRSLSVFWGMGLAGAAVAVGLMFPGPALTMLRRSKLAVNFWNDLWPVLSGALTAWAVYRLSSRWVWRHHFSIPPGDLWVPMERLGVRLWSHLTRWGSRWLTMMRQAVGIGRKSWRSRADRLAMAAASWELAMQRMAAAGILFLLLILVLFLALAIDGDFVERGGLGSRPVHGRRL